MPASVSALAKLAALKTMIGSRQNEAPRHRCQPCGRLRHLPGLKRRRNCRERNRIMSNLTAIVTCLALLLYAVLIARVGSARVKYNILAPATTGHPAFERAFRIQANTAEQL